MILETLASIGTTSGIAGIVYTIRSLSRLEVKSEDIERRLDEHSTQLQHLTTLCLTGFKGEDPDAAED